MAIGSVDTAPLGLFESFGTGVTPEGWAAAGSRFARGDYPELANLPTAPLPYVDRDVMIAGWTAADASETRIYTLSTGSYLAVLSRSLIGGVYKYRVAWSADNGSTWSITPLLAYALTYVEIVGLGLHVDAGKLVIHIGTFSSNSYLYTASVDMATNTLSITQVPNSVLAQYIGMTVVSPGYFTADKFYFYVDSAGGLYVAQSLYSAPVKISTYGSNNFTLNLTTTQSEHYISSQLVLASNLSRIIHRGEDGYLYANITGNGWLRTIDPIGTWQSCAKPPYSAAFLPEAETCNGFAGNYYPANYGCRASDMSLQFVRIKSATAPGSGTQASLAGSNVQSSGLTIRTYLDSSFSTHAVVPTPSPAIYNPHMYVGLPIEEEV